MVTPATPSIRRKYQAKGAGPAEPPRRAIGNVVVHRDGPWFRLRPRRRRAAISGDLSAHCWTIGWTPRLHLVQPVEFEDLDSAGLHRGAAIGVLLGGVVERRLDRLAAGLTHRVLQFGRQALEERDVGHDGVVPRIVAGQREVLGDLRKLLGQHRRDVDLDRVDGAGLERAVDLAGRAGRSGSRRPSPRSPCAAPARHDPGLQALEVGQRPDRIRHRGEVPPADVGGLQAEQPAVGSGSRGSRRPRGSAPSWRSGRSP